MDKKQYLTEEHYNGINKKIKIISAIILTTGLLVGGGLIAMGAIKSDEAKKDAEMSVIADQKKIEELESQKTSIEVEYNAKQQECDSLEMGSSDWFSRSTQCNRESQSLYQKIASLDQDIFKLQNAVYYPRNYTFLYMIGAFCIIAGIMISLGIFLITKRRAILAYNAQTVMPVGKEVVEKATPTVAKAAGDIAGSVAEGISRGVKKGKE